MYFISQIGQHDCAFTCLTMMLANYHKDKNYLFLKHDDKEYSFKELASIAEAYNMSLMGIKIDNVGELSKCDRFPIITTLEVAKNRFHSVLITKANKNYIYFYDPAVGKRKMSLGKFEEMWTNKALVVRNYEKTSCPIQAPNFINPKDRIILPVWQILSGISLLIGSYFLNRNSMIYIPIIFFALFVVFELLFRESLIKAMRNMDEEISRYQLGVSNDKYHDFYVSVEKYRQTALTYTPNIIYTMLITIFLTVILAINGYLNIIYIALALLYGAFEALVVTPYIENKMIEIGEDEKEIDRAKNEEEFNHYAQSAREKAYRTGLIKTVFSYLGVAFMLLATVLVMAISQVYNITYVVFYICISLFLKNNFTKVFAFQKQEEDTNLYRNKIINSLNIDD